MIEFINKYHKVKAANKYSASQVKSGQFTGLYRITLTLFTLCAWCVTPFRYGNEERKWMDDFSVLLNSSRIQVCEEHLLVYICKPTTKNGFSILLYSCLNVVVDIRNLFPISSECISSVCPTPTGHVRGHRRNRELCFLTPTTVAGAGQGLWLSVFINGPCRAEWQQGDRGDDDVLLLSMSASGTYIFMMPCHLDTI